MQQKLILFDLDGTLIDSLEGIAEALNETRKYAGLEKLDLETVRLAVGNGAAILIDRTIPAAALAHDKALELFKHNLTLVPAQRTLLYPGVKSGLEELKKSGFTLGVVSNKPSAACKKLLDTYEISPFLTKIIGGDSPYPLKPEPDALLAVKEKISPKLCIMCGDHYTDLEAGRRANFTTILAKYGFGDPQNEVPDFCAENFAEVVEICKKF